MHAFNAQTTQLADERACSCFKLLKSLEQEQGQVAKRRRGGDILGSFSRSRRALYDLAVCIALIHSPCEISMSPPGALTAS